MKVLHYCQEFSPPTQTFIYDQITGLKKRNYEIELCTRLRTNEKDRPFSNINIVGNFNSIPPGKLRLTYNRYGTYLITLGIIKWWKILNRFQPDIIHCHFGWSLIDILPVLKICKIKIPVLVSLHGTDVTYYPALVKDFKSLVKNYKGEIHFTCPSEYLKEEAIKNIGINEKKITVLPNMFNYSFANNINSRHKKNTGFKVINIARLVKWKGHRYLVEAFNQFVKNKDNGSCLTLVGSGAELVNIKNQIKEYGLEKNVDLIDYVKHDDLVDLFKNHHVYIQPSIHDQTTNQCESFGVVVIEAIVSGLPVIVTETGGLKDTVLSGHENSAIIVKEKDSGAIYDTLCRIYDNGVQQDNEYRKLVINTFKPDAYFDNLDKIYTSFLA